MQCLLASLQTPFETFKLKSLQQLTVRILPKLIVVLNLDSRETSSKCLKEGLALFPVVQFKAKERCIIEKIVERRDVFGQLIEGSNLPNNVAYKLGGLKIVRC